MVEIFKGPKKVCFKSFCGKIKNLELDLKAYVWKGGNCFSLT